MKRVAISTLGCKVNTFESELIIQRLIKNDYERVEATEFADIYIINSCTVTAEADRQSRQIARKLKRQNQKATVIMTGCYAQNNSESVATMPEVDWVVGNAAKLDLPTIISQREQKAVPSSVIMCPQFDETSVVPQDLLSSFESQSRAYIQVQQGCDQGCTFCIIHVARGPGRSFPVQAVLAQYRTMVDQGYKEVVVCGVDLGSYGADLRGEQSLLVLLDAMLSLNLDCRIRLSSIDPFHLSDALIDLISQSETCCAHIHLSMQSANSIILKRMKRRANPEMIYDRVACLRAGMPDMVLSADVLVGFPSETENQFADTLKAVNELQIAWPHVFPYSSREGTPAARIPMQIDPVEKKRRARVVRELGLQVWQAQALRRVSSQQRTIIESVKDQCVIARCADYFPVKLHNSIAVPDKGQWCDVKITGVEGKSLLGEML